MTARAETLASPESAPTEEDRVASAYLAQRREEAAARALQQSAPRDPSSLASANWTYRDRSSS